MAAGKWIGGFLGLMTAGPLGALAGFVLGAIFDASVKTTEPSNEQPFGNDGTYGGYASQHSQRGNRQQSSYDSQQQRFYEGQRNTFRFSLLVLASYIIRADGKVMHSEMNLVRQWLNTNFGAASVSDGEQILYRLFDQQKKMGTAEYRNIVLECCQQIKSIMPYEQRLQLLHFLAMVAQADGVVVHEEVSALKEVAAGLGLSTATVDAMLNLQDAGTSLDAAYKVLGVTADATDDELKRAYRRLALQNHPDKVASLGEDVRKAAEKKFQEINAAKETIWKARGIR